MVVMREVFTLCASEINNASRRRKKQNQKRYLIIAALLFGCAAAYGCYVYSAATSVVTNIRYVASYAEEMRASTPEALRYFLPMSLGVNGETQIYMSDIDCRFAVIWGRSGKLWLRIEFTEAYENGTSTSFQDYVEMDIRRTGDEWQPIALHRRV